MSFQPTVNRVATAMIAAVTAALAVLVLPGSASALPPMALFSIDPNPALEATPVLRRPADLVRFDGSRSSDRDADGRIVLYEWDLDGDGTYDRRSSTSSLAQARYYEPGTYKISLRVTDDEGIRNVNWDLLVVHARPVARLTATPAPALPGDPVELDASESSDADGTIRHYHFDLDGNGTYETYNGNDPDLAHAFATIGEHRVGVRVIDNDGHRAARTVVVRVHRRPTALFTVAPAPAYAGETLRLDASGSSDDGEIVRYEWDLDGDGGYETDGAGDPRRQLTIDESGEVLIRLRVTDDDGGTGELARVITVIERPAEPAAEVDRTAPAMLISRYPARVQRDGDVAVRIACPSSERLCVGLFGLRAKVRAAGYPWLGIRPLLLGGGEVASVQMRLSRRNHVLAYRRGVLPVRAYALARDEAGNRALATADFAIRGR